MQAGWSRAQLKAVARGRLLGNYGNAAGALALMGLVSLVIMLPVLFGIAVIQPLFYVGDPESRLPFFVAGPVLAVVMIAVFVVVYGLMMTGYTRLCYRVAMEGESNLNDLLFACNRRGFRFLGLFLLTFVSSLGFLLLSSLIVVFFQAGKDPLTGVGAGRVLSFFILEVVDMAFMLLLFCYFWITLVALTEDPNRTILEALGISRRLLKGNLWRMVKLQLSFLGLLALAYLSFGLGFFWVLPYIMTSGVLFYQQLKAEDVQNREKSSFREENGCWEDTV